MLEQKKMSAKQSDTTKVGIQLLEIIQQSYDIAINLALQRKQFLETKSSKVPKEAEQRDCKHVDALVLQIESTTISLMDEASLHAQNLQTHSTPNATLKQDVQDIVRDLSEAIVFFKESLNSKSSLL